MSDDNQDSKFLGRRQALQLIGMGFTAAGLLVTTKSALAAAPAAAKAKDAGVAAAPAAASAEVASCKAAAPIDEQSKTMRRALQYKEKTDDQAKRCDKCLQFEAKKFGDCGQCKIFTGAVNPGGFCLSFAPIAAK